MTFLPCCLVLLLNLYPGTTYELHLSSAVQLLTSGIMVALKPSPAHALTVRMLEEQRIQLHYALRTGVLPLASLFSDWRDELAHYESAYSLALRVLPAGTAMVILFDIYGFLRDPTEGLFFLACAVATATFGVAAFASSAVRLQEVNVVEGKLRDQIQLLGVYV
jgi:hypothetical protein